jgi:hypothetical protein
MNARAVERAETQLHELSVQAVEGIALGAVSFGAALAGTRFLPEAAAPLLVGGMGVSFLGVRALVRRYLLLEDLALDRDAYSIAAVRSLAQRSASPENRRRLAASIRGALDATSYGVNERVEANRELLEELVAALEDERLALDPAASVTLDRLLTDGSTSCLYDSVVPADELRSRLRRVVSGFDDRRAA